MYRHLILSERMIWQLVKKDFLYFVRVVPVLLLVYAAVLVLFLYHPFLRAHVLSNHASLFHFMTFCFNLVSVVQAYGLLAGIAQRESSSKTAKFIHALPLKRSDLFLTRWISAWAVQVLLLFCLFGPVLIYSAQAVQVSLTGVLQFFVYGCCHMVLVTGLALFFVNLGRFRLIALTLLAFVYLAGGMDTWLTWGGLDRSLVSAELNVSGQEAWQGHACLVYLGVGVVLAAAAFGLAQITWVKRDKTMSFFEKSVVTFALLIVSYGFVLQEEVDRHTDVALQDFPIVEDLSGEAGETRFWLSNPGEFIFTDEEWGRALDVLQAAEEKVQKLEESWGPLLGHEPVLMAITRGDLEGYYGADLYVLPMNIEAMRGSEPLREVVQDLVYDLFEASLQNHLWSYAQAEADGLLFCGLPEKEVGDISVLFESFNQSQLRALRRHIQARSWDEWFAPALFGNALGSATAAAILFELEKGLGRQAFVHWVNEELQGAGDSHSVGLRQATGGTKVLRALSGLFNAPALASEALSPADPERIRTALLTRLDQAAQKDDALLLQTVQP